MQALLAIVTDGLKMRVQAMVTRAILTLAAILILLIGMGFFLSALWIALADATSSLTASLAMGGALTLMGALILLIAALQARATRQRAALLAKARAAQSEAESAAHPLEAFAAQALAAILQPAKPGETPPLASAVVAGLILALTLRRK